MANFMTRNRPEWINSKKTEENISESFYEILKFYVCFSPCAKYCTQQRTLAHYGWKKKPWSESRYLKNRLSRRDKNGNSLNYVMVRVSQMSDKLSEQRIDGDDWYHKTDREKAVYTEVESNAYMSLFYHIRCALAHGRFLLCKTQEGIVYIMENGALNGKEFLVKARLIIKEVTLLHWIKVISGGPITDEKYDDITSVMQEIVKNPSITRKALASKMNESQGYVDKVLKTLKDKNYIVEYRREGVQKGYWVINGEKALKLLNASMVERAESKAS